MKTEVKHLQPGSKVVAYLRDSGHEDQETSTTQQKEVIQTWCEQGGYELTRIYTDEARSGTSVKKRTEFNRMIDYFELEGVPEIGIVVWRFNRISRDMTDSSYFRNKLRRRGVEIYSISEPLPEGPQRNVFEFLYDFSSQEHVATLIVDIKRGQRYMLTTYGAIGGNPPVGFEREEVRIPPRRDGRKHRAYRWVPTSDNELRDRVVLAWQMRANGCSYKEIQSACGLFKAFSSYNTFFRNRLYIGEMIFKDLIIPNYCEPMIDLDTFERARIVSERTRRINVREFHPRRAGSDFLLSGLAFCSRCGAILNGETIMNRQKDKAYRYYVCANNHRQNCSARKIRKDALEAAVISNLARFILEPKNLEIRLKEFHRSEDEHNKNLYKERNKINTQIHNTRKKIKNLTDVIAISGMKSVHLVEELRAQELEERHLLELRSNLAAPETLDPLDPPELEETRTMLLKLYENQRNHKELKKILSGLIQRVDAERDDKKKIVRGTITYFLPGKKKEKNKSTSILGSMIRNPPGAQTYRHKFTSRFR